VMYTHIPRGCNHYVSTCHEFQDGVTGRTQTRPFEERIQGSANLCGVNARPEDNLSLERSVEGEQRV